MTLYRQGLSPVFFAITLFKSIKHFIAECEDLIIVRNEVFESEISRNVFNMREVLTSASTLV